MNRPDGPDYVDEWMKKNLEPDVVEFVRSCCTSFTRWDLLRQLHAEQVAATAEDLGRAIGTNPVAAAAELESLASMGLVKRCHRGGHSVYRIDRTSALSQGLDAAIRAYDGSREFRFALVYSVVRASHRGAILE